MAYAKSDALRCCSLIHSLYAMIGAWKKAGRLSEGKFKWTPPAVDGVASCSPLVLVNEWKWNDGFDYTFESWEAKVTDAVTKLAAPRVVMKAFASAYDALTHSTGFRAVGDFLEFDKNYGSIAGNHILASYIDAITQGLVPAGDAISVEK